MLTSPTSRGETGFTLLEILVVLVIAGAIVVVAQAALHRPSPARELRREARQVAADLRLHREAAIERGMLQVVSAKDVHASLSRTSSRSDEPANNLTLHLDQPDGIWFAPDGSTSGGTVHLDLETASVRVVVDWLTGGVRVDRGSP